MDNAAAAPRVCSGMGRHIARLVAALACGLLAGCASSAPHQPSGSSRPADAHQEAAQAEAGRLLAAVVGLPGAHVVEHAPVAALAHAPQQPGSDHLIDRVRWWSAPGTVAAALEYLRAHRPAGLTASGSGSLNSRSGPTIQFLTFAAAPNAAYTDPELLVTVTRDGAGVAMRADAQLVWLPTRSAHTIVPPDVTSVDVTVDRRGVGPHPTGPIVRRTLDAGPARQLARLIDTLQVFPPGTYSCPAAFGFRDALVFHAAAHTVTADVTPDGCATVSVGNHAPTLTGGRQVDQAVLRLLGLPSGYGFPQFHSVSPTTR